MTEVFRSEANDATESLVASTLASGCLISLGLVLVSSLVPAPSSSLFGAGVLILAAVFVVRARKQYKILRRYIQCPPNTHITVDNSGGVKKNVK